MVNMSGKYTAGHEAKQNKIEKVVLTEATPPPESEKRATLSLSLTVNDKKMLKIMAAEHETTIALIIHEWTTEHTQEMSK